MLFRSLHRSGKTGWLIACAAACAVETIFRPYALLFWVFPLTAVWQNKRRRAACLGTAAGGFAVSLFAMAKLAAPYFSDGGMDFDGIRLLLQLHPVAAVRYECALVYIHRNTVYCLCDISRITPVVFFYLL